MFGHFSEKAVKVIVMAQEESRRLGHNFVGTEQILLGLVREGTSIASSVLALMGIKLENARTEVEKLIGRGSGVMADEIPFTVRAKAVLDMADELSLKLGHSYIGTEHLLLGIVGEGEKVVAVTGREPNQSLAFQVLQSLGVEPFDIRARLMQSPGFGEEMQGERFSS